MFSKRNKKGFTLIELIVVIAVLGILVLLAAPKFLGYTNDAKIAQIKADIKTYETALAAELVDDDKFSKDWTEVDESTLEKHKDDEKLFSKKGLVDSTYQFDGDYVEIPNDIGLIKTDLKGDFFLGEGGEVYYYDEKVKIDKDKGSNGGSTGGSDKEVSGGDKEVLPVANLKVQSLHLERENWNATAFVIDENGDAYAKGKNSNGNAGVGNTSDLSDWTKVNLPSGVKVKEIVSIRGTTTFFVTTDNDLYASGSKSMLYGNMSLAGNELVPIKISTSKVKDISESHVVYENGDLYFLGGTSTNEGGVGCRSCIAGYQKIYSGVDRIIFSGNDILYYNFMKAKDGSLLGSGYWYDSNNPNAKYLHFYDAWTSENDSKFGKIKDYKTFSLNDVKGVGIYSGTTNFLLNNGDVISDLMHDSNYYTMDYLTSLTFDATVQDGVKTLTNIKEIHRLGLYSAAGVIALSNDDKVYAYGENSNGFLQLGHSNKVTEWTHIPALSGKKISEFVVVGKTHVIYRTKDNRYFGFGVYAPIGLNSATPVELNLNFN